jgi:hypothetical protein
MTQENLMKILKFSNSGSFLVHSWDSWESSGFLRIPPGIGGGE